MYAEISPLLQKTKNRRISACFCFYPIGIMGSSIGASSSDCGNVNCSAFSEVVSVSPASGRIMPESMSAASSEMSDAAASEPAAVVVTALTFDVAVVVTVVEVTDVVSAAVVVTAVVSAELLSVSVLFPLLQPHSVRAAISITGNDIFIAYLRNIKVCLNNGSPLRTAITRYCGSSSVSLEAMPKLTVITSSLSNVIISISGAVYCAFML